MSLSTTDLRAIRALVSARCAAGPGDPRWQGVLDAVTRELGPAATAPLVFRLTLPIGDVPLRRGLKTLDVCLTPTLNAYAGMPGWKRALARAEVDRRILAERTRWPNCSAQPKVEGRVVKSKLRKTTVSGRRRLVVVTRRSSRQVDELSCDVLGAKLPIDRLAIAGILAGDSAQWIEREASWEAAPAGEGSLVLDVYDLG